MTMLEQLKEYLEWEYKNTKDLINNPPTWCSTVRQKEHAIWNTINRCLGATMFAQRFGVSYEDTYIYEEYRKELLALIDKC